MSATMTAAEITFTVIDADEIEAGTSFGSYGITRSGSGWVVEDEQDYPVADCATLVNAKAAVRADVAYRLERAAPVAEPLELEPLTSVTSHTFASTREAYDASQCDDSIRDGDVLSIPSECVVAILVDAWPIAVTEDAGDLHAMREGDTWETFRSGRYVASHAVAQDIAFTVLLDAVAGEIREKSATQIDAAAARLEELYALELEDETTTLEPHAAGPLELEQPRAAAAPTIRPAADGGLFDLGQLGQLTEGNPETGFGFSF